MGGKSTHASNRSHRITCCGAYVPAQSVTLGRIERILPALAQQMTWQVVNQPYGRDD